MLALTDEALARVVIAATRIKPHKRSSWLRRLALRIDPSPNAVRLRNARERQNNGVSFFRVALNEVEVAELCIREGLLLPGRDYNRKEIERALARFIAELCKFDMHVEPALLERR